MQPIFRKAVSADAPQMAQLLALAWQKAYRGILSDALLDGRDAQAGTQRIRNGIETRAEFQYYVLEQENRIVGVSVVCPSTDADTSDAIAIQVFYIHPDFQRRGLGRILMRYTLAAIKDSSTQPIILWVLKENHNARAFYKAMGFQADGAEKTMEHLEQVLSVRYRYAGDRPSAD